MNRQLLSILAAAAVTAAVQAQEKSPYISQVFDFCPAPGQFVNEIPEIPADADAVRVCELVLEQIGRGANSGMISLGAFGGYVIFGLPSDCQRGGRV